MRTMFYEIITKMSEANLCRSSHLVIPTVFPWIWVTDTFCTKIVTWASRVFTIAYLCGFAFNSQNILLLGPPISGIVHPQIQYLYSVVRNKSSLIRQSSSVFLCLAQVFPHCCVDVTKCLLLMAKNMSKNMSEHPSSVCLYGGSSTMAE